MQLAAILTPGICFTILAVVILGGVLVRRAGASVWWILAGIAGIFAFTNPTVEEHSDELHREIRAMVRHQIDGKAPGAGRLAAAAWQHFGGDTLVDKMFDLDYQNFLLFSRTSMDGKTVSVGFLGNVFVELPASGADERSRRSRSAH